MRKKECKIVITFDTTTHAFAMEEACEKNKLIGRLLPVPREITAGCGLCFCLSLDQEEGIHSFLEQTSCQFKQLYKMEL